MRFFSRLAVVVALLAAVGCASPQYAVVLSMDGFRWDYPQKFRTPHLDSLAAQGVRAQGFVPEFPTKTFPNHLSMATGQYPDRHGFVNNGFYDEHLGEMHLGNPKVKFDARFYGGEPIWATAEKQGMKAATYFWVGSDVGMSGMNPTFWKRYEQDQPFEQRVDSVLHWMSLPEKQRPRLAMLYFHEPDNLNHHYGPDSPEVDSVVRYVDSLVGRLQRGLRALPHGKRINLVVVSDHGVGPIDHDRYVVFSRHLKPEWVQTIQGNNPVMNIKAVPAYYDSVYTALKAIPHLKTWKSKEVPAEFKYGSNPRTLDFTVVADSLWSLARTERDVNTQKGTHGYEPTNRDMDGIFYAQGPAFKRGYVGGRMQNLNLYGIICRVLGLRPADHDGEKEVIAPYFR